MNNLNHTASQPANQTGDERLPYSAPTLVTFGAIRDLTAGGSIGSSELAFPGSGKKFGHHS